LGHESNTFTPFLTTLGDFYVRKGQEMLDDPRPGSSLQGIVATLRKHGVEIVPTIAAGAMPGGVVQRSAYETFKEAILKEASDVDGACVFLHGAMRAEGVDYCDNDILMALRKRLGPEVPITVALDMHANIVAESARNANATVAYHTAPHTDEFDTGAKAAEILMRILKDGVKTNIGFAKVPFLLPGEMAQTSLEPMAGMMRMVSEIEAMPGVMSASLANGHCWADVPEVGVAAVVVTNGDASLAQREAERLATAFWKRRKEFGVSAESYPVDEAIDKSMSAKESTVFLSDSGDNPGAGGTTDVPYLLERLIAKGARDVLIAGIWDPEATETCSSAGARNELTLSIGGKIDKRHGSPLEVSGKVTQLADDGPCLIRRPTSQTEPGKLAVLTVEGVDIILSSNRISFEDPAQLRGIGLEPLDYRIVVLKRGYLTTPFEQISKRSILAISPGATNCDVTRMEFQRLKRPVYPLDPEMSWEVIRGI